MYIEHDTLEEYPYEGTFYIPLDTKGEDGDLIGDDTTTVPGAATVPSASTEGIAPVPSAATVPSASTEGLTATVPSASPLGEETIILTTMCDIQETTKGWSAGAITASFNVYFPFEGEMPVRRGMMFRSEMYGMPVNGTVAGVIPNQLGGCVAYIKDVNA